MKTLSTFFVIVSLLLIGFSLKAQELTLLDKDNNDITNGTLTVNSTIAESIVTAYIYFFNDNDVNISVLVRKVEVDVIEGTINYFCWKDLCLEINVFEVENPIVLEPGETSTYDDFYAAYWPMGIEGTSIIRYEFFSDRDDFDQVVVTVYYVIGEEEPNSVMSFLDYSSAEFKSIIPNPAKNNTELSYSLPMGINSASIRIHSITGRIINEISISPGSSKFNLDTSFLTRGMYMLSLVVDGAVVGTRKLVVNK
jgi:hypothetical protein